MKNSAEPKDLADLLAALDPAADLAHRHLFKLENPTIQTLKLDYQRYLYDPLNKRFARDPENKSD